MKPKLAPASPSAPPSALEVLLNTHLPGTKVKRAAKELGVALPKMATSSSTWTPDTVTKAAASVLGDRHRVTSPRLIGEALKWLADRGVVAREGKNSYRLTRDTSDPVGRQILTATPGLF